MEHRPTQEERKLQEMIDAIEEEDTQPGWEPVKLRKAERRRGERRRGMMFVDKNRRSGEDRRSGQDRRSVMPRKYLQ